MEMETSKIRVMVVEDDVAASIFIAEVLKLGGYEAIIVNDSSKAMEIASSALPAAFLLDLMMPPPDGFKLCRMLRADPTFHRTPILIVTALDNTDSKIVAIGAGANDYLVKPFQIDDLLEKVKYLLGK
jgi:DNA-binding response OmpR family regulator